MMKNITAIVIFSILFFSVSSCYYDKQSLLYGLNNVPCTDTTTAISYSQRIAPLLQQYCYSCHTGGFPSGNITMGSYQADKTIAQNGKLLGSISHAPGFAAMPQGQSKLNNCQVAMVKKWIDEGALNN